MGSYYYSDEPKTDMNAIKENKENNSDFKEINRLCKKDNQQQQNKKIEINKTFKFLTIRNIWLGFNSCPDIYAKYKNHFKAKGLKKRDASHPSLFFDFGEGCSYYVDYMPDKGASRNAEFLYGTKLGLRYASKEFEEFVAHNDTLIIKLKANNQIKFYDYFTEICRNEDWTKDTHDYEKHNCNHFILKSLQLLNVELREDNFEENFLFPKLINSTKRDAIKDLTPFIFHNVLQINY